MENDYPALKPDALSLRFLHLDIQSFKNTVLAIDREISSAGISGEALISAKRASHFNLGVSFELLLKFLLLNEGTRPERHHGLLSHYLALSGQSKRRIQEEYLAKPDTTISAYIISEERPSRPEPSQGVLESVEDFLNYLDKDVKSALKRYEWEEENVPKWVHFMDDIGLATSLIDRILGCDKKS